MTEELTNTNGPLGATATEARELERRKQRRFWLGAAAALVLAAVGELTAVLAVQ